jgi:hypothetical protein
MKILTRFRPWDATVLLAFLLAIGAIPALAQQAPTMPREMEHANTVPGPPKERSTSVTISLGENSFTLDAAALGAMPHETVTVVNGHTKASETYTGVPIAALLVKLGLPFTKANEHTLLKTYIVAEGTDGYKVLVSTYETLAAIREKNAIVADSINGQPLANDGAFKLVIPGDTRPQRWVQNLKSLTFKTLD